MKRVINLLVGAILIVVGVILYILGFMLTPFIKAHKYLTAPRKPRGPELRNKMMQEGIKAIFSKEYEELHPPSQITVGSCVKAQYFDKPLHVVHIDKFNTATMVFNLESPHPQVLIQRHVSGLELIEVAAK